MPRLFEAGEQLNLTDGLSFTGLSVGLEVLEGAAIRVDYHRGLRFGVAVNRRDYDLLTQAFGNDAVQVSILIVPTDYLADGTPFTEGALSVKYPELAKVINDSWFAQDEEQYYCYGTLSQLKPANYARSFSAAAFLTVTMPDHTTRTIYAAYDPASHARSAYGVAQAVYEDTENQYSEEVRNASRMYLDGVVDLTVTDGACRLTNPTAGYTSPYTVLSCEDSVAVIGTDRAETDGLFCSVMVNGTVLYGLTPSNGKLQIPIAP